MPSSMACTALRRLPAGAKSPLFFKRCANSLEPPANWRSAGWGLPNIGSTDSEAQDLIRSLVK